MWEGKNHQQNLYKYGNSESKPSMRKRLSSVQNDISFKLSRENHVRTLIFLLCIFVDVSKLNQHQNGFVIKVQKVVEFANM